MTGPAPVGRAAVTADHDGLVVRGVGKTFGVTRALAEVDLDVRPGEVVALLGENGAGKSTLANIVSGVFPADTGTMTWRGEPYAPNSPGEAIAVGIGLIHQEMRLLPDLSIAENVFVGRQLQRGGRIDRAAMNERAARQLQRLGLEISPTRTVRSLRVAAQQQVEIAKALTLDARLLLLDEPTAALGERETERLFEVIKQLRGEGMSFVYVSHRLEEIARIADRIVVLRDGRQVAAHDTADVTVPRLIEQMVGRSMERIFPAVAAPRHDTVLEVNGLTARDGSFSNMSFHVRSGEIFGIAGIVGAGRTELVRAVAGADPVAAGAVRVAGRRLPPGNPRAAIAAGLVMVPEDRKAQGVVLDLPIEDNIAVANLDRLGRAGWVGLAQVREVARHAIGRLQVKGRPDQPASALSGGNQQKVVIAKWLERGPRVVILDEPTRGIDVGARAAIYQIVADLAEAGLAVVMVSSELEEVLGLAHRVLVLSRGRDRGTLDRADASDVEIMRRATA